jgi:hypothetical protein
MTEPAQPEARIFSVDTQFQRMARRPGGVPRQQAVDNAQRHVDEMKPGFVDWLDRELQELAAAVQQYESAPADATVPDRAHQISRELRDVGATMGFDLLTFVAENLCDIFDAVAAGATYDKDAINCHVDALFLARTRPYQNLRPEQLPEITSGLRRVVERATAGSSRKTA